MQFQKSSGTTYVPRQKGNKKYLSRVALLVVILLIGIFMIGIGYIYPAYVLIKADLDKAGGVQIVEVNPPRYELQSVCFQGTSYITNGYSFKEEVTESGFFVKCDEEI